MREFVSELERIIPVEELVFEPTPGFGPYKQYFPEDAIQHPAKANTYLVQFLVEKFTEEGDTVLDPMAGTGSTGVIAALHGRNAILLDIEEKFVKWMEEAKKIVDDVQTLTAKGKIAVLKGDARQLSKILNGVDSIVTSPPYSEGIGHDSGDNASEEFKERLEMQRRYTRQMISKNNIARLKHGSVDAVLTSPPYSETYSSSKVGEAIRTGKTKIHEEKHLARTYTEDLNKSNIGNLSHGNIDSIITSPPYERSDCVRESSGQFWEKAKEMGKRWGSKPPSGTEERQYSEDNIGSLSHGEIEGFIDCCLMSPPYADAKKGNVDEERMAERWDKAAEDKDWNTWSKTWRTEGRKRGLKSLGSGYSESEENIGNLPVGDIDAVITSPPYSESVNAPNDPGRRAERMRKAGLDPKTIVGGKARCGQVDWRYGEGKDNIGSLSHGEIDAVITSPPYLKSADAGAGVNKQREGDVKIGCSTKGREVSDPEAVDNVKSYGSIDCCLTSPPYEESMSEKRHATPNTGRTEKLYKEKSLGSYPHSENQIGAMKKETYLEAMLKVYSEMFKVLKKGGKAIVIVKPFIRDKKVIDLPHHTWLLMQKAGFKLEKVMKLRLKNISFWRILYEKRFQEVPKIRHEYIIVARK